MVFIYDLCKPYKWGSYNTYCANNFCIVMRLVQLCQQHMGLIGLLTCIQVFWHATGFPVALI